MSDSASDGVRLNRFLASCGAGSRRGCESLILEGRVTVNGKVVHDLATRVLPTDHVKLDGKLLQSETSLTVLLNKPTGFICTTDDPQRRKTVYELLPKKFATLHYVGRLDYQSCGLLLLTNEGDLTEKLTHPRYHIEKEYEVTLDRPFFREDIPKLLEGIPITEGLAKAVSVEMDTRKRIRIVLAQGYNRQIRRMLSRLDYKVRHLERVRIGDLRAPGLSPGDYRILTHSEIQAASRNPTK